MDLIQPEQEPAVDDDRLLELYGFPDSDRPWVRFNFVSSLDGAATVGGIAAGLSEPEDQRLLHLLRRPADVLLIGAGTVRAEGYGGDLLGEEGRAWRARHGMSPHPPVAIVSGRLDLDPTAPVFADSPTRPLVITAGSADDERRRAIEAVADVIIAGDRVVDPAAVVAALTARGHRRIHSEGGPALFGAFQDAALVDELCLSLSPVLAGGPARRIALSATQQDPQPMRLQHVLRAEDLLLLLYRSPR